MDAVTIPPPQEPTEPSTLADRLANVIAAPGEVFDEVKDTPVRALNWVVPLILACMTTAIYISVAFSQPPILLGMQEQRVAAFHKQVAAGKLTQEQADQAAAMTERIMTPKVMKMVGAGGAVFAMVAGLFLMAMAIWLALKYFSARPPAYMKVVEICGLALVIDVPQKILRLWLVLWKQNLLATASPTLFLASPNAAHRTDVFLSMIDVVDFWWLAVLSLGLSKIASINYRTAAFIAFGVWFGFRIIAALMTPSN